MCFYDWILVVDLFHSAWWTLAIERVLTFTVNYQSDASITTCSSRMLSTRSAHTQLPASLRRRVFQVLVPTKMAHI